MKIQPPIKFIALLLVFIIGAQCYAPLPLAFAATSPEDDTFEWWPNGAEPDPIPDDRQNRHCSWWWPGTADQMWPLWGNRGVVYLLKGAQGAIESFENKVAMAEEAESQAKPGLQMPCFGDPFSWL